MYVYICVCVLMWVYELFHGPRAVNIKDSNEYWDSRLTWIKDIFFKIQPIKRKYRFVYVEWSVVKYQLCKPVQPQKVDELFVCLFF